MGQNEEDFYAKYDGDVIEELKKLTSDLGIAAASGCDSVWC